jgi:hypothetical protein
MTTETMQRHLTAEAAEQLKQLGPDARRALYELIVDTRHMAVRPQLEDGWTEVDDAWDQVQDLIGVG